MIPEVAGKVVDVTAKVVEVSAKAAEVAKETGKTFAEKSVDITKRIDITKLATETNSGVIDITKRIKLEEAANAAKEIGNRDIFSVAKEYISDLRLKSEVADTIKSSALDVTKLEPTSPEQVKKLREEFDDNKSKLRREWERIHNREWPRYDHDVYNQDGVRIRKVGDCYDAHHIQPLNLGGRNEASNLTPLDLTKHGEIHSSGGSCTKLVDKVLGGMA